MIQARRFRPARFRPNDSGRTIQAGHDSGRSRFRPVTIQAHLDSGQICTIQAWHDSGPTTQAGHDSGQSRFRPITIQAHLYSGPVSTIQAQYARFRPNTTQARHNSGQFPMIQASHDLGPSWFRPDTFQGRYYSGPALFFTYCPSYLTEPNQIYARSHLTPAEGKRRVWMYAGIVYVFQSWVRFIQVWGS